MTVRWPRNDLKTYKATVSCKPNRNLSWLALSSASTQSQHDIRTGNPQLFLTPSLQTRSMKGAMASFLPPHSLHFSIEKHPFNPSPTLSFIYHIFCPTETFQRGRESHQSGTQRGRWPHRKLLIPAGMSRALENCQTQWTQCWCWSTIARLKINPAR